jgi:pimeloyl-ACP methyl ester carboxylesterase
VSRNCSPTSSPPPCQSRTDRELRPARTQGNRFVESMRYGRRFPEELALLAGLLPQITVLVTIINGRHDRVVPIANAEFLDHRLPVSLCRAKTGP